MSNQHSDFACNYQPLISLQDVEDFRDAKDTFSFGDRRDGKFYAYSERIKLAVNVAMATGRPLLVLGPSGCGKSSLAYNLARKLRRRYYEFVVTSRSEAGDLLYRFDAVRRLGDACQTIGKSKQKTSCPWEDCYLYIEPGPLWWIYDRDNAACRGATFVKTDRPAIDPKLWPDDNSDKPAVLLIDEVDKGEPDFPNNLLVPLASRQFTVLETGETHTFPNPKEPPLIIITSNQERALPNAFLRRCVVLNIPAPTTQELVDTALTMDPTLSHSWCETVAAKFLDLYGLEQVNYAEYLDALQALRTLQLTDLAQADMLLAATWQAREG